MPSAVIAATMQGNTYRRIAETGAKSALERQRKFQDFENGMPKPPTILWR